MRLLIDADEISKVSESFRGIAQQLVTTSWDLQGRGSDGSALLEIALYDPTQAKNDGTVRELGTETQQIGRQIEDEARLLDERSMSLDDLAEIVRNEASEGSGMVRIPKTRWRERPVCVLPKVPTTVATTPTVPVQPPTQPVVAIAPPLPETVVNAITPVNPEQWRQPPGTPPLVEQVQATIPEETLPPKPKKSGGWFGNLFKKLTSWLKDLWNKVKKIAAKLWTGIQNVFKKVWTALKNLKFKDIIKWAAIICLQFVPGIGQAVLGVELAAMATTAYQIYQGASTLYNVARRGIHSFGDVIGLVSAGTGFLNGVGQVGGSIGQFARGLSTSITTGFNAITTGVSNVIGTVTNAITSIPARIGDWIGNLLPATGVLGTVGRTFAEAIGTASTWIKTAISTVNGWVTGVYNGGTSLINSGKTSLQGVIKGITDSIGQSSPQLGSWVGQLLNKAVDAGALALTSTWDELYKVVSGAITEVGSVTGKLDQVQAVLNGGVGASRVVSGLIQDAIKQSSVWTGVNRTQAQLQEWQNLLAKSPERIATAVTQWTKDPLGGEAELRRVVNELLTVAPAGAGAAAKPLPKPVPKPTKPAIKPLSVIVTPKPNPLGSVPVSRTIKDPIVPVVVPSNPNVVAGAPTNQGEPVRIGPIMTEDVDVIAGAPTNQGEPVRIGPIRYDDIDDRAVVPMDPSQRMCAPWLPMPKADPNGPYIERLVNTVDANAEFAAPQTVAA
jgi:hypothetical protein